MDGEEKDEGSLTGARTERQVSPSAEVGEPTVVSREGARNEGAKMESGKRKSESAREKEHRRGNGVAVRPPRRAARRGARGARAHEDARARARAARAAGARRGNRSGTRGRDEHAGASVPPCLSKCSVRAAFSARDKSARSPFDSAVRA